jgi:hypothetical protein
MEYLIIYILQLTTFIKCLAIALVLFGAISLVMFFDYRIKINEAFLDEKRYPCTRAGYGELAKLEFDENMILSKKIAAACLVSSLFLFLIPTKQTLLLMTGTYLGKRAVSAVATSDKLEKINTIIDLQLDKYIKELQRGG